MNLPRDASHSGHEGTIERGRELSSLLALTAVGATTLDETTLHAAGHEVDAKEVYASAYRQWRGSIHHEPHAARPDAARPDAARPVAAARSELALRNQQYLLAVHTAAGLRSSKASHRLSATMLLSEDGRALTSPWQQWTTGTGWQASDGSSGHVPLSAQSITRRQIDFVSGSSAATSAIHLFNDCGQTLLRDLCDQTLSWLTLCTATTKVQVDSTFTTLACNAKLLDYRCLDSAMSRLDVAFLQGTPLPQLALWAAWSPVQLVRRGACPLRVAQVCLRLVDRRTGTVLKTLHGLTNLDARGLQLECAAVWLAVYAESRRISRTFSALWVAQSAGANNMPIQERAATLVQSAMAVWYANQSQGPVSVALKGLAAKPGVNPAVSVSALSRLFAMKYLLESSSSASPQ